MQRADAALGAGDALDHGDHRPAHRHVLAQDVEGPVERAATTTSQRMRSSLAPSTRM